MIVCSFCGLAAESPHETQAACIEALQTEISRVRQVVDKLKDPGEAAMEPAHDSDSVSSPSTEE
jgi:hypothetical protein